MASKHIQNIAIVGAGGQIGGVIAKALISQGKHKVTGITRPDSKASLPEGLHEVKKVEYTDHASVVQALKGQEVLIITMSVMAPRDTQTKLIDAAKEAGVTYIMPNEYGINSADNEQLGKDVMLGPAALGIRAYIEKAGMKWISLACGFWYEFSLGGSDIRYGFNFTERKFIWFNDGNTKITTTTWPQCGRAVAKLFALPVSGASPCLSDWDNRALYIKSFDINQREMFDSVLRVTGTKESDWTITREDAKERFQRGQKMFKEGNMMGFGLFLYSRIFYPEGDANFSDKAENEKLGLPQEDLDEATKVAVQIAERDGV